MILPPPDDAGSTIDIASTRPRAADARASTSGSRSRNRTIPIRCRNISSSGRRDDAAGRPRSLGQPDRLSHPRGYRAHRTSWHRPRDPPIARGSLVDFTPDNPLSMTGTSTWTCDMRRPGWFVRTVATARDCLHPDRLDHQRCRHRLRGRRADLRKGLCGKADRARPDVIVRRSHKRLMASQTARKPSRAPSLMWRARSHACTICGSSRNQTSTPSAVSRAA